MNPKSGSEGTIVAPAASDEAMEATTDQPGKNTRYGAEAAEEEPQEEEAAEEQAPEETSWIEIELIDEADQAVPGSYYEITAPDGKVHDGTTDADGCARVDPVAPGTCQISFPKLDQEAWEFIESTGPREKSD